MQMDPQTIIIIIALNCNPILTIGVIRWYTRTLANNNIARPMNMEHGGSISLLRINYIWVMIEFNERDDRVSE